MKSSRPLLILLMAFSMQACAQGNAPVPAAKPATAKPAKTAFTGADAYRQWLSGRGAVHVAGDQSAQ